MNLQSSSLLVPFTFSHISERQDHDHAEFQVLEAAFSRAQPRTLNFWAVSSYSPEVGTVSDDVPSRGIVIGSQDGTFYLFNLRQVHTVPGPPSFEVRASRPTSPSPLSVSRQSRAASRSSSLSATPPPPFNVTPRRRVVSGITPEQVEAPKNFVDFDEEPDKLKDMLKGQLPKDSSEKQVVPDSEIHKAASRERSPPPSPLDLRRKYMSKFTLSTTQSPPLPPNSPSNSFPLNTTFPQTPQTLDLWCHIIPPRSGFGTAVTSICLLEDQIIAVLQEMGDLSIFSLQDGTCLATAQEGETLLLPPAGVKDKESSHDLWSWNHLKVYHIGESTILLASAAINPDSPSPATMDPEDNGSLEKCNLALFEFHANNHLAPLEATLLKIGHWFLDSVSQGIGLHHDSDDSVIFFTITTEGRFMVQNLQLLPRVPEQMEVPLQNTLSTNLASLPLPNPFKASKSRSPEHSLNNGMRGHGRVELEEPRDLGKLLAGGSPLGFRARNVDGKMLAATWSQQELAAFTFHLGHLSVLYTDAVQGVRDVQWTDDSSYTILFEDRAERYTIDPVDYINGGMDATNSKIVKSKLLQTMALGEYDAADIGLGFQILTTSMSEDGSRKLTCFESGTSRILWQARTPRRDSVRKPEITSLLPIELDVIVGGYADGRLRQLSVMQMLGRTDKPLPWKISEAPLSGYVTGLHIVRNSRTKERFIVGGADDGSIAFWSVEQLKLCARWVVFTTPLTRLIHIRDMPVGPLSGCVLCISADGTIAVVAIDGFHFLCIIPGAAAPLHRVCLGGNNLLLVYADRRARLWDMKTQEFWRSMGLEKAEELLEQGGWADLSSSEYESPPGIALKTISGLLGPDAASTLILDIQHFTSESATIAKAISTNREQTRAILLTLERLRSVISALLTPGLSSDVDTICFTKLGLPLPRASIGSVSRGAVALYSGSNPRYVWCLSGHASAARALAITVVLNALSLFEEFMEGANTVIIFYATSLAAVVGPRYKPFSLDYLARRWFDGSNEVRRSARTLFDHTIACLPDDESISIAEHWQHHLPCLQPTADRESVHAALALFLCGYLASEKYSLFSTSALTDISKSIALYLHDEKSLYRVLAVDLCSRGFHVWQHYIDAMEILRALFTLATSYRKDSISLQNVGTQARLAILQIASSNTALFMTTLGLDILNPPTLEHRKSVLQIVAYLIRKRPLVLQPNIPKLLEAVVKSLDPTVTTYREAVFDTATDIIGYVVKTFPNVDFHMSTQRLAVGTDEGAVIMYDLKTAIRLYVLEGHKKPISACSFSPDGRRLVTLSLGECVVLVWKVGSSFTSFFYPGAPPRQGHGGSEPFKTINFHAGSDGNSSAEGVTEWSQFEWTGDRSVKLRLRESIMTFST